MYCFVTHKKNIMGIFKIFFSLRQHLSGCQTLLLCCFLVFFCLICCRNREDFCDCNRGSSVFTHFHGLVHHQQHQTGDYCVKHWLFIITIIICIEVLISLYHSFIWSSTRLWSNIFTHTGVWNKVCLMLNLSSFPPLYIYCFFWRKWRSRMKKV